MDGRPYRLPDLSLFDPPQAQVVDDSNRAHVLEDTLASFGVGAKVIHIERGPSITRYELKPERGIKISKIASLSDDLALALAATSVRIEAPIPGKSAVGIEIPNQTVSIVAIREILEAMPNRGTVPPLWMALGKDITGRPVFGDLTKMPHLLVAGATGAGKSVCLNTIIASLLVNATPDQVQLLMIDPKRVELTVYNGIPHLIKDAITDARLAAGALFEMTKEMDSRYERFAKAGVRKIEEYNAKFPDETLPYIVIIIDELADLMLVAPAKVETTIMRIAQLARATGIHLIVATQRPSVDVITGLIKANIPSRIAFAVSSQVDSRTILDMNGAERLLGRGDMLYLPIDAPKPIRAQGALIGNNEVTRLVDFWAKQARPDNLVDVDIVPVGDDENRKDVDPLVLRGGQVHHRNQLRVDRAAAVAVFDRPSARRSFDEAARRVQSRRSARRHQAAQNHRRLLRTRDDGAAPRQRRGRPARSVRKRRLTGDGGSQCPGRRCRYGDRSVRAVHSAWPPRYASRRTGSSRPARSGAVEPRFADRLVVYVARLRLRSRAAVHRADRRSPGAILSGAGASPSESSCCCSVGIGADFFQHAFARPRRLDWVVKHETAFSYPSSHAAIAVGFYLLWAEFVRRSDLPSRVRGPLALLLAAVAVGILWSRLALGAHYVTDLFGGALWALAVIAAGLTAFPTKVLSPPQGRP